MVYVILGTHKNHMEFQVIIAYFYENLFLEIFLNNVVRTDFVTYL